MDRLPPIADIRRISQSLHMFDDVPVRVWLLLAIAATAYQPVQYLYRHWANSPSRRDITQPPEDLSWRTSSQFVRNLAILAALIALAGFIFTPAAAQMAQSPIFWPILMIGGGAWTLSTVPRGVVSGRIQPIVRGIDSTYARETQPKRFWASLVWNAVFGCLFIWLAFQMNDQASANALRDQCYDEKAANSPQQALSACNKLIEDADASQDVRAGHLAARGIVYHLLGDYHHAVSDYDEAIRLDPQKSSSFFNRGLIHQQLGDSRRAIADYTTAIQLQPNNADAYLNRGIVLADTGKVEDAVADFNRANELDPKDPRPLVNRGIIHVRNEDWASAEKQFQAARIIDPSNPLLLRGEALLFMRTGDMEAAVDRLNAALSHDPRDVWSVRMRAEAYWRLGEYEKSRADTDKLLHLSKGKDREQPARDN